MTVRPPARPFRLVRLGHTFVRLWAYDLICWNSCGTIASLDLHPWERAGPSVAVDGNPRFDFTRPPRFHSV